MGFRFHKSVSLGGGVRLNFGKRGVGMSAGVKGFRVSFGPGRRPRVRASLSGTGLSYDAPLGQPPVRAPARRKPVGRTVLAWVGLIVLGFWLFGACAAPKNGQPPATLAPATPALAALATSRPPTAIATPAPTRAPSPSRTPITRTLYVGNTDGEGVYLRRTPSMEDRSTAYAEGTSFRAIGNLLTAEGRTWWQASMPDGAEGYLPATFVVASAPGTPRPALPTVGSTTSSGGTNNGVTGGSSGCGSRGGPGYRLPSGKCASWRDR